MGFAAFVLERRPDLARRLGEPDAERWLASTDSVVVDGERLWIVGGDQLVGEAEAKLGWARERGLVSEEELRTLEEEWGKCDPDTETVDLE